MHNSVNLMLKGKGGIGKSFASSMLAKYAMHKESEQVVTGSETGVAVEDNGANTFAPENELLK